MPGARKLITISLPPPLLKKAERIAEEEHRTKSELLREALRFYLETRDIRRAASRERLAALIDQSQTRAAATRSREIRKLIREAVASARSGRSAAR
jgi:metal-responsive CopG/Arc/MetJ family transcriptional regulator